MSASMEAAALGNTNGSNESEEWFDSLPEKIQNWYPDEAVEYLQTVEEIQTLIESFGCLPLNGYHEKYKLLQRVHDIPQMAILRLKEAFNHIYNENSKPLEPENLPFQTSNDDKYFANLIASADDDRCKCTQAGLQSDNTRITELKCIAEVMFASGHDAECCQGSTSMRKEALKKCLLILEVEELGSEDVLQMDCSHLNSKIKNWFRVVKIFIRFYLACEKNLTHKVLGVAGLVGQTCFIEGSKSLILQLLRFGEAVTIKNHSPEKFFPILYMFDGFVRLLPYIHALFSAEAGSFVRTKVHEVRSRLGMTVKSFLNRFMRAVKTNESSTPFTEGGVYHLTVHVMMYIQALADCSVTLSILLEGGGQKHSTSSSSNVNMTIKDDSEWSSVTSICQYLQSIILTLELNLESKSRLYTGISLKQIFLMNNISYVLLKVKDSELQPLLGERWIREQEEKIQEHVTRYKIASWSPIHVLLSSEGASDSSSGSLCMAIFKQRIQDFNRMFEEIYRTQTAWLIYDDTLREVLRASISVTVHEAYQTFLGALVGESRHCNKYIKYSVEDLNGFILNLFEGSPRSLHNSCRLKEVLSRILIENKLPLDHKWPFQSSNNGESFVELIAFDGTQVKEDIINLVNPNAISDLKRIAEVMFASGYDAECCEAYISIRKNALQECLRVLEVEKLVDGSSFDSGIKKWIRAVKILVTVYLAREKSLAHEIFGVFGSVGQTCFIEASKGLILQLLSFGKAVATKNHSPENIVPILYMYEGLLGLLSNIQVLFLYEADSAVSTETREILSGLGDSVRRSLNEFKYAVGKNESSSPFAGSGVHHLTMDVVSYLQTLTNHSNTLNILLKCGGGPQEGDRDDRSPLSSIGNIPIEDDSEWSSSSYGSPIAWYIQSTISVLESNLESNSRFYTNVSLKQIFLMNNIHYMAQKVKKSKLGHLLGENWMREHNEKFQQHAVDYESASWSPVHSFLRDEGIHIPQSSSVSKATLKVRSMCFNLAFGEIYKTQTAWLITDVNLLAYLRISISSKLLLAYQAFLGKYFSQQPGKRHTDRYIKYSVMDLRGFLLDLFRGSPKSLPNSQSLNEEFSHILIEIKKPMVPEYFPFQSRDDDMPSVDLIASMDDGTSKSTKARSHGNNMRGLEEYIVDLVHPNAIPGLKCIVEVMFASGYDAECCETYISSRTDALEDCLFTLEVEKLSIKDVLQMDSNSLNSKIKNWVQATKIFICMCLPSEKSLAHEVFGVSGSISQTCFIEASKSSVLRLLSFGEFVAMRNHTPEKICSILYMCDELMGLLPNIEVFFSKEVGSCVRTEVDEVLTGLGESVVRTLNQFKNATRKNELRTPFAEGGVHHLTRYVMKYLKALTNYSDTLNFLLEVGGEFHLSSSSNVNRANADDEDEWNSSHDVLPVAQCFQSIISILESNLESKSRAYTDVSQQHFFLMNNICYMVEKVKDFELEPLLGEKWVRKHDGKFQQHALNYERISWIPVISLLTIEGICKPRSNKAPMDLVKDRFKVFNLAFEEIYRTQNMWLIQNAQLRDHLRMSISSKLFLAYHSFSTRFSPLAGRYFKYSAEDLGESLLDLFEGLPKPLHRSHRHAEAHELLNGLGESVIRTSKQFKNAIKTNELHTPFAVGGVHHLTRYVMQYLKALTNYSDTLNFFLKVGGKDHLPSSYDENRGTDNDDDKRTSSDSSLPMAQCIQSIISILDLKLKSKSQLSTDVSQKHFFLMNNICYMLQKVKDSELEPLPGESWLRKQDGKFLQHALNYERISWSPVLSLSRYEGIWNPRSGSVSKAILKETIQGFNLAFEENYRPEDVVDSECPASSGSVSKAIPKERILGFNLAFEEIYWTQGMWLIQNAQLRDHVRISISSKLFLAYGSFSMKFSELAGRYLKYSVEDLVECLLDLYDGLAKPLLRSHGQTQWR
ncbi:hypothetical protein ACLOJK_035600 [Asimina triloba]